jgi:hypothetical protein
MEALFVWMARERNQPRKKRGLSQLLSDAADWPDGNGTLLNFIACPT